MGFISIALFLIGLFSFFNKHKHLTLMVIIALSSGYFRLVNPNFFIGPLSFQHSDLALLLIFLLLPVSYKATSKQLRGIQKALILFFIFLAISILYDFLFRGTSIMQIFRTTRKIGYLMFFFLMGSFSWRDYQKFIKFLIILTVIHATFYISQYVFGYSYTPDLDGLNIPITNELDGIRYPNGPTYVIPVLVICVFLFTNDKKYGLIIIALLISIILGQSRGAIIAAMSIALLYLFLQKKINLDMLILIPLLIFVGYTITTNYFPILGQRFTHLYEEFYLVDEMDYNNLQAFFHEGSFIFRVGVTYERLMYVLEDPIRIILGVGFVPDIDIVNPIFDVGTYSPTLPTEFEQYNSIDIFFPNIITRYGIVGSIIYLYFLVKLFTFSFKNRKLLWGKILFTYLILLMFISLINETFYNGVYFILIFIPIHLVLLEKRKGKRYPNLKRMVN